MRPPFRLLPGVPSLALPALGLAPGEPRLQGVAGRPFCWILARPFHGRLSLGPAWTRPSAGPVPSGSVTRPALALLSPGLGSPLAGSLSELDLRDLVQAGLWLEMWKLFREGS